MPEIPFIGVDFSGAQNAGEKIWVARAFLRNDALEFDFLACATELEGGERARDVAISALVFWLQRQANARIGCDFPFALREENLEGNSWRDWLFSLDFADADAFRAQFSDGARATDKRAKTPFSPLNLRMYRQTFYGMRDVLVPLLRAGARAIPFEDALENSPILLEICPASLLKSQSWYWSYKGKSAAQCGHRAQILNEIATLFAAKVPEELRKRAIENDSGDALDAILATVCVFKTRDFEAKSELERREGRVCF